MSIFVDSGAPTLYNTLVRKDNKGTYMGSYLADRKHDDFSYVETEEYKSYRRAYILFVKKHLHLIDVYANLDVINNAELTWENQQYLESKGLKPIPVWHFGNDIAWLKMYLEKGYDYIAIGGLIPNPPNVLIPALDDIWSNVLTDSNGMPKVKVHGFAVTSTKLVCRYPWWSVDSTSWVKFGKYGIICVPPKVGGVYKYNRTAHNVCVSTRSPAQSDIGKHFSSYSQAEQAQILSYVTEKGQILGKSEFKEVDGSYELADNERWASGRKGDDKREVEVLLERGLCNDYRLRDEINIQYYLDLEASVPPWPWAFKPTKELKGFFEI